MDESRKRMLQSAGLLVLRLGAGGVLLGSHGWGKLASWSEKAATFPDPLHVGSRVSLALVILAEVVCAAAVAIGALTRAAAVGPVIMMIVAFFVQHAADPFGKKELALVYGIIFLAIALTGAGDFSVDALVRRRRDAARLKP
jgi:putative oxidoreductase